MPLIKHLQKVERATGKTPKQLRDLPERPALFYLYDLYCEISGIEFTALEVKAWLELSKISLSSVEIKVLFSLNKWFYNG